MSGAPFIGLDTETTGLDPHTARLRLLQLATPTHSFIVDVFQTPVVALQPLLALLTAPQPIKVAHNAKFEAKFLLKHCGIILNGIFDTYLASQLIAAGDESVRHSLASVAQRWLGYSLDKEEQRSDWSSSTLSESQLDYAARDAQVLLPLQARLQDKLVELDLTRVAQIEFDAVLSLAAMEIAGVYLDAVQWRALIEEVRGKHEIIGDALRSELAATASQQSLFDEPPALNLDSPAQLQAALNQHLGLELNGTREWQLQKLVPQYPLLTQVLEYRHLSKSLSSYGENILEHINKATGRIHAEFRQLGTPTGRITATQPSLQQIRHDVAYRSCFTAPAGRKLITADYSQIEMRILADFANDEALLQAFISGADLHRLTYAQMHDLKLEDVTPQQREAAKHLNYGLVYGMGAEGLASQINSSVKEAELLIEKYFSAYAGVARWLRAAADTATREGRSRTASGRLWVYRLDPRDPETGRQQFGALQRVGKNTPIQGSASDIFKRAMTLVHAALLPHDAFIVNSIHDEIVVECAAAIAEETKALVVEAMTAAGREFLQRVPVVVEAMIGNAWLKK